MLKRTFILFIASCSLFAYEIEIDVPLYLNTEILDNIKLNLNVESDSVSLIPGTIESSVNEYLTRDAYQEFLSFIQSVDVIPENNPKGNESFKIYFDTANQTVHLEVLCELLKPRITNVTKPRLTGGAKGAKKIEPSTFSGYLNIEGGLRDRRNIINAFRPEGLSSFGNLNACVHYNDFVFNGFGYFLHDNTWGINPGGGVVSKEIRDLNLKLSAGTINSTGISFQGSLPIIGMNLSRKSDLITDSTIGSMSRHDLFLNAPSEIRIKVNGIEVNRVELPAGNHILHNFPLAQGLNNVVLDIKGPTGEDRTIDLTMFYNPSLMKVGEVESNISFGIPNYDFAKGSEGFYTMIPAPAFSGYVRGGALRNLTLGGYFQSLRGDLFSGIQGIFSAPYFKSIAELGLSSIRKRYPHLKTRIAIFQPDAWKIPVNWGLSFEGTESGFRYFGGADTIENTAFLFSSSLGANFYGRINANMVYQYGYYRDVGNKNSVQGTLSIRPLSWMSIRGMVRWEDSDIGDRRVETAVNFDISPRYKEFGTKTMYNTRQKALLTAVTYNKMLTGRRNVSGSVGFNSAPGANQLEGRFAYDGSLIQGNVSQRLYKSSVSVTNSTVAITNASLGTALVFAGKKLAVSRPVRDSFVIIAPNQYLRHDPVLVNPASNDYLSKATYYFPSVISMGSYSSMDLSVVKEDGMYGGAFENTLYNITSKKNSGAVLEVGDIMKLIVEGVLYDRGELLEGATGMLISEFKHEGKELKYRFFTDEEGVFQVLDVIPGKYKMRFTAKDFLPIENIEVEFQEDGINFVYLGEYQVERIVREKKKSEVRL